MAYRHLSPLYAGQRRVYIPAEEPQLQEHTPFWRTLTRKVEDAKYPPLSPQIAEQRMAQEYEIPLPPDRIEAIVQDVKQSEVDESLDKAVKAVVYGDRDREPSWMKSIKT